MKKLGCACINILSSLGGTSYGVNAEQSDLLRKESSTTFSRSAREALESRSWQVCGSRGF